MGAFVSCFDSPMSETTPAANIPPQTQDTVIFEQTHVIQNQNAAAGPEPHQEPLTTGKSIIMQTDLESNSPVHGDAMAVKNAQKGIEQPDQFTNCSQASDVIPTKVNGLCEENTMSMVTELSYVRPSVWKRLSLIDQLGDDMSYANPKKLSAERSNNEMPEKELPQEELKGVKEKIAIFNKLEELASIDVEAKVKSGDKRVVTKRKSPFVRLRSAVFEKDDDSSSYISSKLRVLKQKKRSGKHPMFLKKTNIGKQARGRASPQDISDFFSS